MFDPVDLSAFTGLDVDVVGSLVFHIGYDENDPDHLFDGYIEPADLDDFKDLVNDIN